MTLFDASDAGAAVPTGVRRTTLVRLSSEIGRTIAGIGRIAVEGEVHQPQSRPGGRIYFTLKDRAAQMRVTVPAAKARRARTVNGERVLVTGRLEWVSNWGTLQIVGDEVVPVGEGAVAAMIADARARLDADGLLSRPRRRLPALPRAIGVICGSDAAVRHDIESVVAARSPGYPMVFREVTVSGAGAADAIVAAIDDLCRRGEVDVIVLARGGGDATQLLPFSDEDVCRAVCAAAVPVVSAIGHERDRPLCDEVADLRCGTPSLAAAAVVPDLPALATTLDGAVVRAGQLMAAHGERAHRRLAAVDRDRAITVGAERAAARLSHVRSRLELLSPAGRLITCRAALAATRTHLDALSPQRVLERGFAIVRGADGRIVRMTTDVTEGDTVDVQVAGGRFAADVRNG